METGAFTVGDWPSMTLAAQILFGSVFCKIFGLSFVSLRWATLVTSLVGSLSLYALAKRFTTSRALAAMLSLTWFFNPVALSLSFTFMTEIYFQTTFVLALYGFVRIIETDKMRYYIWATVFSVLATLVRQPGLLIPFAFGLAMINVSKGWRQAVQKMTPFAITLLVYLIYDFWLKSNGLETDNAGRLGKALTAFFTQRFEHYYYQIVNLLLFPGLFLLPLLIVLLPALQRANRPSKLFYWLTIPLFILFLSFDFSNFPVGNIFYNFGLGPKILKDSYWGDNLNPMLPSWAWQIFKIVAFPAMLLTGLLWQRQRTVNLFRTLQGLTLKVDQARLALTFFLIIYSCFILVLDSFFDRYLLPLIPCLGLLILPGHFTFQKKYLLTGVGFLSLYAFFAITATHDYLSWNKARWEAYKFLTEEKEVRPNYIDAGFEINAWYEAGASRPNVKGQKSWWFVSDDDYVLSFGPIEGFRRYHAFPYHRWLPPGRDSIFILWHDTGGARPYDYFPLRVDAEKTTSDGVYFLSTEYDIEFTGAPARNNELPRSGENGFKLTSERPFALTLRYRELQPGERFVFSIWRYGTYNGVGIVFSSDYGNLFYRFETNNIVEKDDKGWEKLELGVTLPEDIKFKKAASYIWNTGGEDVWLDDFEVQRLPPLKKVEPTILYREDALVKIGAEEMTVEGDYLLDEVAGIRFGNADLRTSAKAHTGSYSIQMNDEKTFAWNVRYNDVETFDEFKISLWQYGAPNSLGIVFSTIDGESFYVFEKKNIVASSVDGWRKLELHITIPEGSKFTEAASYLWNHGGQQVWIDDLEIRRRKSSKN